MAPMTQSLPAAPETGFDQLLGFTIPERDARGRIVRLGPVVDEILAAHDYPAPIKHCLAEALVLTALMGGLLKGEGDQLTVQAQTEGGVISLLVCDYRDGQLRGYAQYDDGEDVAANVNATLETLFGKGYLAITFDIAKTGRRYQGIVPLEGSSLAQAVEAYFFQSEQVPTLVRTGVSAANGSCIAAGILVQHLPDGEEGRERLHARLDHPEWEHIAILGGSIRHGELVDEGISLESLVWRLFHEEDEVRISAGAEITRGCRCSVEHYESVLARFPKEERREMANDDGVIVVDCAFCSREFAIQD